MIAKCRICGKPLKNWTSIRLGIGPVCLAKLRGEEIAAMRSDGLIPPKFCGFLFSKDLKNIQEVGKMYMGQRLPSGGVQVVVIHGDGSSEELRHIRYHSPSGFEWGYGGSGPSDLARSILADFAGMRVADICYQAFKHEIIANLAHKGFAIPGRNILDWLKRRVGIGGDNIPS